MKNYLPEAGGTRRARNAAAGVRRKHEMLANEKRVKARGAQAFQIVVGERSPDSATREAFFPEFVRSARKKFPPAQ